MGLLTLIWGRLAGTPSLVWQCLTVVIYDSGFRKLLYYYLLSFGLSEASFDSHHHIVHCRHSFPSIEIDTSGITKKKMVGKFSPMVHWELGTPISDYTSACRQGSLCK